MTSEYDTLIKIARADMPRIMAAVNAETNRLFCEGVEKPGKLSGQTREIPFDDGTEIFRLRQEQAIREVITHVAPLLVPDAGSRIIEWTLSIEHRKTKFSFSMRYVWNVVITP